MLLVLLRRVSTGEQVGGGGLDRQTAAAEQYAEARGWQLHPETYSDEGVSGFSGANLDGDLGRFLSDLKAGRFGTASVALGVEDLDRLSRQFTLAFLPILVDDLLNAGVTISVMAKSRDISRASIRANPMELHELLFWMGGAHEFSSKLSGRIGKHRSAIREAIRDSKPTNPGTAPSWISLEGDHWVLNDYAATIRRVVAMAQAGDGAMVIARTLNAEGVPSPGAIKAATRKPRATGTPPPKRRPPARWDKNSVLQVLKSPALHGARKVATPGFNERLRAWREECVRLTRQGQPKDQLPCRPQRTFEPDQEGYYPALITPAEHQLLLHQMAKRRTTDAPGRKDQCAWIGQRLTTCICGAVMTTSSSTSLRGGVRRQYKHLRCTGRRDGTTTCKAPLTRFEEAQAHLLTRLSRGDLSAILRIDAGTAQQQALAAATQRREELATAVEGLLQRQAAGEDALNATDDPAVLTVLARRQAALDVELSSRREQLVAAELELEALMLRPPLEEATKEAEAAARKLLLTFADGKDTPAIRSAINAQLRRIGLRIVIDGTEGQVGLAIGQHGALSWASLAPVARTSALRQGEVNPPLAEDTSDGRPLILTEGLKVTWGSFVPTDLEKLAEYRAGIAQAVRDLFGSGLNDAEVQRLVDETMAVAQSAEAPGRGSKPHSRPRGSVRTAVPKRLPGPTKRQH